jgi:hypothetical protein
MSLNNLILTPHLVAELYPRTLIQWVEDGSAQVQKKEPTPSQPTKVLAPDAPAQPLAYLGHFQRQILVVVEEPEAKFIGDEALAFLTKVLQACQLTLADVGILNAANQSVNQAGLADLKPKVVLEFGTSFFGSDKTIYQPTETGFFTLLRARAIQQLLGNDTATKQEKAKLWQALQAIFLHGK